jgi:hypothetical protein
MSSPLPTSSLSTSVRPDDVFLIKFSTASSCRLAGDLLDEHERAALDEADPGRRDS